MLRFGRVGLSIALISTLTLGACADSEPAGPEGDDEIEVDGRSDAVVEGRTAKVSVWSGGKPGNPTSQPVLSPGDPTTWNQPLDNMSASLLFGCLSEDLVRRKTVVTSAANHCDGADPGWNQLVPNVQGARASLVAACVGHWALAIADSNVPTYSLDFGSQVALNQGRYAISVGKTRASLSPANLAVVPSSGEPTVRASVVPRNASERASWALLAVDAFRISTTMGAALTDPMWCPVGGLDWVYKGPDGKNFSLKDNLAATTADSLQGMMEAASKAREYVHAAAKAKHSTSKDSQVGRVSAWRDAYDSLLRGASAYFRVPGSLYEPKSYCENYPTASGCTTVPQSCLSKNPPAGCARAYPVVTALSTSAADRRAEQLLRDSDVDPRIGAGRTVGNIADDLLWVLNVAYNNSYRNFFTGNVPNGAVFLEKQGIKEADLERAARRVSQQLMVMGRPVAARTASVLLDLDGPGGNAAVSRTISYLDGLKDTFEPVNPWYLYATTVTSEWSGYNAGLYPTVDNASLGVFHALDYFRYSYLRNRNRSDFASARKVLDGAAAFVGAYLRGRVVINACDAAPADCYATTLDGVVDRITLQVESGVDAPYTATELMERFDLWLGEEGLKCALSGQTVSGQACDPAQFKILEATTIGSDSKANFTLANNYGPAGASIFRGVGNTPLGKRIYVTELAADGIRRLVAGFTPRPPPTAGFWPVIIPFGPGVEEALSATLAADPYAPDDAQYQCGDSGLPRNIRVGLESELTQSVGGLPDNSVDESWSYYLKLADAAAAEADMLGDDLVAKGLEMDMRAEDAREELEDLCGGVIDVPRIRDAACGTATNQCDIMAYLESDAANKDADLMSLRQCLGIDSKKNAALGSKPVCLWRMKESAAASAKWLPYGVCPTDAAIKGSCPGRAASGPADKAAVDGAGIVNKPVRFNARSNAMYYGRNTPTLSETRAALANAASLEAAYNSNCAALFPKPTSDAHKALIEYLPLTETLGLNAALDNGVEEPEYTCLEFAKARTALKAKALPADAYPTREMLAGAAKVLGIDRDDLNFVSVTRDKLPWLSTASNLPTATAWAQSATFPCAAMAELSNEEKAQLGCGTSTANSLLCGLSCAPYSAGQLTAGNGRLVSNRSPADERLAKAIELLRVMTGSKLDGIEVMARGPKAVSSGLAFWDWDGGDAFDADPNKASFSQIVVRDAGVWTGASTFTAKGQCDWSRYREVGYVETTFNFCSGDDDILRRSVIPHYTHPWNQPERQGTFREVCLGAAPAAAELFAPPQCSGDPGAGPRAFFVDAGALGSWPTLDPVRLEAFWKKGDKRTPSFAGLLAKALGTSPANYAPLVNPDGYDRWWKFGVAELSRSIEPLDNYTHGNLLDAIELSCVASRAKHSTISDCSKLSPADWQSVKGIEDFPRLEGVGRCMAGFVRDAVDSLYLLDAPSLLVDSLKGGSVASVYPAFQGSYAQSVGALQSSILEVSSQLITVKQLVEEGSAQLGLAESRLRALGYQKEAAAERASAQIAAARFQCISAMTQAATATAGGFLRGLANGKGGFDNIAGAGVGAAAGALEFANAGVTCKASNVQTQHTQALEELDKAILDEEKKQVIIDLAANLLKNQKEIEKTWVRLQQAYTSGGTALAQLAQQRNAARRAAAKILMLDNDDVGRQYAVNTAMRARMNTLKVRYDSARKYAVRMAYIARRAIEQKIGMNLSELESDVGWVPAPRSWADTLCSLTGINYAEISDSEMQGDSPADYNYAGQYIGDYVKQLGEFVTAYENTYTSGTGRDTVVVSVRDELLNVRSDRCEVSGVNELLQAARVSNFDWSVSRDEEPLLAEEVEQVWEQRCSADGYCTRAALTEVTPFGCYTSAGVPATSVEAASDCPAWGKDSSLVRAVRLLAAPGDATPTLPSGVEQPWAWYRAETCEPNDTETALSCPNLSGMGPTVGTKTAGATPMQQEGAINGWSAVRFDGGTLQALAPVDGSGAAEPSYTLAFAVQIGTTTGDNDIWLSDTPAGATTDRTVLEYKGGTGNLTFSQTTSFGTAQAATPITLTAPIAVNTPVFVTVRVTPTRAELYTDGVLRAFFDGATRPTRLSGTLGFAAGAGTDSLRLAEVFAFPSAPANLSALNAYLSRRYKTAPASYDAPLYAQVLNLPAGRYLLSWYEQVRPEGVATPAFTAQFRDRNNQVIPLEATLAPIQAERWLMATWVRRQVVVRLGSPSDVSVGFLASTAPAAASGYLLAAPQLELIPAGVSQAASPFFPTDDDFLVRMGVCEDRDGSVFRAKSWNYGCEYYCPAGLGADCASVAADPSGLPKRCYHELKFRLSQEEIEKGELIEQGGFSVGNFNYRFEDIAVNIVGTAVKNCELSETPSACYANNFLQYTLRHDGPFLVRNYFGEDYEAPIYPGRIQQGKALLAERYLTNPLASADQSLLSRYWDSELVGRPLSGNYSLRVYDAEGLDWNKLEDVQIVMNYRYWTKSQ